ncbi:MAG: gamma-glutamyltransferase [Desulfobacteraceae bacterium]|nr:MAG: gamma-glutamyltransferase [Desulfobacteraceae bacterium]
MLQKSNQVYEESGTRRMLLTGNNWMITTDHPLATQAGAEVLAGGGHAVDAAIAANLVLTVVRPHMCSLGGDLFALIYSAQTERLEALNASGCSPLAANIEKYRAKGLSEIPETGILTATVPGVVRGWYTLLERFGTRTFKDLSGKAIESAQKGFYVDSALQQAILEKKDQLTDFPNAAAIFLPDGRVPLVGQRIIQKDLAQSIQKIAVQGPEAFYCGSIAESLVHLSQAQGGFFSKQDFEKHQSKWVQPLQASYRGREICTLPPNSQGIALLMQARILEQMDLSKFDLGGGDLIHYMVEAKKLAFADRDRYVCDPGFTPVPVNRLLSAEHGHKQFGRIHPDRAAGQVRAEAFTVGGRDTVYLAVVDQKGNAVSLIQSIYEPFGSCMVIPDTGIILHNRGRGFSLNPAHPNGLEPGKRPYHTLHPAMVLKNGRPQIVLGSPGADGQTQTVMQMLVAMLDHETDMQTAVEVPRWRSNPDGTLWMEGRFDSRVVSELKGRGHRVELRPDWDPIMGSAQAIRIDYESGFLLAGADPRRQAYAIGS